MTYIITVNRDAIDREDFAHAIRVEKPSGAVRDCHTLQVLGDCKIVSGPARQDGARVWIEANDYVILD